MWRGDRFVGERNGGVGLGEKGNSGGLVKENDGVAMVRERGSVAMVREGAEKGRLVAHVSVKDGDAGVNGMFECQLSEVVEGSFESSSDNFRLLRTSDEHFRVVTAHSHFRHHITPRLHLCSLMFLAPLKFSNWCCTIKNISLLVI